MTLLERDPATETTEDAETAYSVRVTVVEPYVKRCGHALSRTGFELSSWVFEEVVGRDPVLLARMRAYPKTGTLDGMDTCDRDRLLAAVSGHFLREPWPALDSGKDVLKPFLARMVAAVTARGAWA